MLATELAARIHAWKGCDFPPILVFQLTSVTAIAAYLDRTEKSPHLSSPVVSWDLGSSLVPSRPTPAGMPIFLVPRLSALGFRALAKHLGSDHRVYGLEPPGLTTAINQWRALRCWPGTTSDKYAKCNSPART